MTGRIYLDATIVIYLVEQVSPFAAAVEARLRQTGIVLVASELTRLECRVKPLRLGDVNLLRNYDEFFNTAVSEITPLSADVIDRATAIRAPYGFKTPDAIHLAAAVVSGCDVFLTNDSQFDRFTDIKVELVQP